MCPARSSSATMPRRCPAALLTTDGKPGVKVSLLQAGHDEHQCSPDSADAARHAALSRTSTPRRDAASGRGRRREAARHPLGGDPDAHRDRRLQPGSARRADSSSLQLDGKHVTAPGIPTAMDTKLGRVHLEAGKPYAVDCRIHAAAARPPHGAPGVVEGRLKPQPRSR